MVDVLEPLWREELGELAARCPGIHFRSGEGLYHPAYYASFLAMIIGPLLHVALTAATKGRYYEPAHASANRVGGH